MSSVTEMTKSLEVSFATERARYGGSYRPRAYSHSKSDPTGSNSSVKLSKPSLEDKQQQRAVIVTTTKQQQQPQQTNRYKTELCRPFQEYGHCRYGDKCQFAHGKDELKTPVRHPRYKTELCRTYHSQGYCPYGARCHFVHSAIEARPLPSQPGIVRSSANVRITSQSSSYLSALTKPPLSPSQDSGISSPPEAGTPNSVKVFEYPLSDNSSSDDQDTDYKELPWSLPVNEAQFNCESSWDTMSNDSFSPIKSTHPLPFYPNEPMDDLTEHFSTTSLDDSLTTSRSSRLPIFNQLNSFSDISLSSHSHDEDWW